MSSTKDKMEFAFHMAKHSTMTQWAMQRVMRYAATLDRLAVKECNEPWTDADETKVEKTRKKLDEICKEFDIRPVYSRDPRGAVVKLRVPDGFTNDWGKEGICVPTPPTA